MTSAAQQQARKSRQIDPELSDALLRAIKDAITYSGDRAAKFNSKQIGLGFWLKKSLEF